MLIEQTQAVLLADLWDDKQVYKVISSFYHTLSALCARSISVSDAHKLGKRLLKEHRPQLRSILPEPEWSMVVHIVLHHLTPCIKRWGPVANYWAYPFERFMSFIKTFIRQRARPELGICMGYVRRKLLINTKVEAKGVDGEAAAEDRLEILNNAPQRHVAVHTAKTSTFQHTDEDVFLNEDQSKALKKYVVENWIRYARRMQIE